MYKHGGNKIKRKLITLGLILLFALIAVCCVFLNRYLSNNNYLLYATATKEKAFLNAKWKMSPKEIERANKTFLVKPKYELLTELPEVTDQKRFSHLMQSGVSLWGHNAEIQYMFFDNMLYEYYIGLTAYSPEEPHKEILEGLRKQFGEGKQNIKDPHAFLPIPDFEWHTEKQHISYWITKKDKKDEYYLAISTTYKPFYEQIEEIAKTEKKKYF
jgi:hypothetical protein